MPHPEYEIFKNHIGDRFSGESDRAPDAFRQRLGKVLFDKFEGQNITGQKNNFIKKTKELTEDLWHPNEPHKIFSTLKNSSFGHDHIVLPLYFVCHKIHELNELADELDGILDLNGDTFLTTYGWAPTKEFSFDMFTQALRLSVKEVSLPDVDADKFAPILTVEKSSNPLHYANHLVDVIGRDDEQRKLRSFLKSGKGFKWLQLAGVGGQGKSRLAYELVQEAKGNWHAGFLVRENLNKFADICERWVPARSTLIVVDYVLGREEPLKRILQTLVTRSSQMEVPVRLLIVERQRWDRGGIIRPRVRRDAKVQHLEFQSSDSGMAQWFLSLNTRDEGDDEPLAKAKFEDGVIELTDLDQVDFARIVQRVNINVNNCDIPDKEIHAISHEMGRNNRPLYAYYVATALRTGTHRTGWTRDDLLTSTLEREQGKRWRRALGSSSPSIGDDTPAVRLALLATMVDGFDNLTTTLPALWQIPDRRTIQEATIIVDGPMGTGAPFSGLIPPLQPDILGEWFVLASLSGGVIRAALLAEAAWEVAPEKMATFLQRITHDFPERPEIFHILNFVPAKEQQISAYSSVCVSLFEVLSRSNSKEFPKGLCHAIEYSVDVIKDLEAIYLLATCKLVGRGFAPNLFEGARLSKKAAQLGQVGAMFNLGICYANGLGVEEDQKVAFSWFSRAAEANDHLAMYYVGMFYGNGQGVEANAKQSFSWLLRAAEGGNVDAMYLVAKCYHDGDGVRKNALSELEWLLKAAASGHYHAMFLIGKHYRNTKKIRSDPKHVFDWFFKAAEGGVPEAMHAVGMCYKKGYGVKMNANSAFNWLLKASNSGHHDAMKIISSCYFKGQGTNIDEEAGLEWFLKSQFRGYTSDEIELQMNREFDLVLESAENGNPLAMFDIGLMYDDDEGIRWNPKEALGWFLKATEAGDPRAMLELGMKYRYGEEKDLEKSFEWFLKAAECGFRNAMYQVGCAYHNGDGVEVHRHLAFTWFLKAAEAGHIDSMYRVGLAYGIGEDVIMNAEEAFKWTLKAAEAGNVDAMYEIGFFYHLGKGVRADPDRAFAWFLKSAESGNADAFYNVGVCYYNGYGTNMNRKKALFWFRKGADAGDQAAEEMLSYFDHIKSDE